MKATLESRLRALPHHQITPTQVLSLASGVQPTDLRALMAQWQRFSDTGLETLEALAGVAAPNRKAMEFTQGEHWSTGVKQQSALAWVSPEIGFVTAGDDKSALWGIKPPLLTGGDLVTYRLRKDHEDLVGMEGICVMPKTGRVRVMTEENREVFELELGEKHGEPRLQHPEQLGEIGRIGKKKNKGPEGLTVLPANLSPDKKEWLIVVNEGDPCKVAFVDPKTLETKGTAEIPESVAHLLPDLSDVAVSPKGTLFILSDEGEAFVEFAIRKIEIGVGRGATLPRWTLVPLGSTKIDTDGLPLDGAPRLQPEGISFDHRGDVWLVCEANGLLIHFPQKRS